jgi:hypothetical protein
MELLENTLARLATREAGFAAGCFRVGAEMPLVSDTPVGMPIY